MRQCEGQATGSMAKLWDQRQGHRHGTDRDRVRAKVRVRAGALGQEAAEVEVSANRCPSYLCALRSRSAAAATSTAPADGREANGSEAASASGSDWPPASSASPCCTGDASETDGNGGAASACRSGEPAQRTTPAADAVHGQQQKGGARHRKVSTSVFRQEGGVWLVRRDCKQRKELHLFVQTTVEMARITYHGTRSLRAPWPGQDWRAAEP